MKYCCENVRPCDARPEGGVLVPFPRVLAGLLLPLRDDAREAGDVISIAIRLGARGIAGVDGQRLSPHVDRARITSRLIRDRGGRQVRNAAKMLRELRREVED